MSTDTISILGCGWFGTALGKSLVASGHAVMGSTTRKENFQRLENAKIKPFLIQLSPDKISLDREFLHCDVLVISLPHGTRKGLAEQYKQQVQSVLNEAQQSGTGKIIMISTTSVYPNLNRVVHEEDADADNLIVQAEQVILRSALPGTVIRFGGLYGPGRDPGKFLSNQRDVIGGNAPVNLIHLDDCVEIVKQVIAQGVWDVVLNACADEHPLRKIFYTKAAIAAGMTPPIFSDHELAEFKIVSNERLKAALDYTFIHRLE